MFLKGKTKDLISATASMFPLAQYINIIILQIPLWRNKKRSLNMVSVKELMCLTFAQRQKEISEHPMHISTILEKFPRKGNKEIVSTFSL